MKVCMLVYNNVTKDNRVMREASTLQAAGHEVTVLGIPDEDASTPVETMEDGVKVHRVMWQANAYGALVKSSVLRVVPAALLVGLVVWGLIALFNLARAAWPSFIATCAALLRRIDPDVFAGGARGWLHIAPAVVVTLVVLVALSRVARVYVGALVRRWEHRQAERERILRHAETLFETPPKPGEFPAPRSLVPAWIPEFLLELLFEPLDWAAGRAGRFLIYRYRSKEMAKHAIALKPDVVHAHDCMGLPTGVLVKKALGIPLVYDAHEIYEGAAARRFGIVDYYIRTHRRYMRYVDRFITINKSAALFYRYAYPYLPPATIIRNATSRVGDFKYDGRLHDAAGLPRSQKILLYQGGYTKDRGLPILVRAGRQLPDGWTLVMMGWGPLAGELRKLAALAQRRNRSAMPKVRFVPAAPRRELHLWTAGATAGIIPYENTVLNHWICTPNKLWEYPSVGVPLIVQPFPELQRVVKQYGCGWILPERLTPGAIADLVASLTDEKIARAKEGCRKFIEADCWEAAYQGPLLELYASLAPAKASAGAKAATVVPMAAVS
jgi:glycosyltransferase involved in cell wall biosynthesis